jgi:outer membrane protein TolC
MCLSMLKINSVWIFSLLLAGCTAHKGSIEVPEEWHTPLTAEMTLEDPSCFPWWETFGDDILNDLIGQTCKNPDVQLAACAGNALETANKIAADIARSYMELRGLQERLEVLDKQITSQDTSLDLNEGLSGVGFISAIHQNGNGGLLYALLAQKSEVKVSIDRAIFRLATLTTEPLNCLYERLSSSQGNLSFPCKIPIGTPCDIVQNHPGIKDARKAYRQSHSRPAFLNYQKVVLNAMEGIESALAALQGEQEVFGYLENVKDLKGENDQLTKDLNHQGLKSDAELQTAYQELLSAEDAYLQSKTKLLIDYVNLYQAQGGGFRVGCE